MIRNSPKTSESSAKSPVKSHRFEDQYGHRPQGWRCSLRCGGEKLEGIWDQANPTVFQPFLWKTMSTKQRRLAIVKEEREKARKAFPDDPVSEDPEASSSKVKPAITAINNGLEDELPNIPLMPVAPCIGNHSDEKNIEDALDVVVLPALSANPDIGRHSSPAPHRSCNGC